jgi:hypothetical protein
MITGSDTVLITARKPGPAAREFLDTWAARWVDMRICVTTADDSEFIGWPAARASVPDEEGELLIVRDADMESAWDEHGYQVPGSTEGPIAILYQPCTARVFSVTARSDPYARDALFRFDPYDVLVVGSGLTLVTIVTPDTDSEFSKTAIDKLVSSLS